jgi:hypothetical protein
MEKKIMCTMKKFRKNENGEKIPEIQLVECEKIKVFIQKSKAQVDEKDIIDTVFVHYRDHKGRPVQLGLRENPEVTKVIREKIFKEFGKIKIKAEGNLVAFSGQPCIEFVVAADASCFERNRFKYFSYARCEAGLWKFDPIQPKHKSKIRRLDLEELVVAETVEKKLERSLGKIGDACPELAGVTINHEKIASTVSSKRK